MLIALNINKCDVVIRYWDCFRYEFDSTNSWEGSTFEASYEGFA
jgi:hypothetical protein